MTTPPVMTLTDELLEELEYIAYSYSEPVKVDPEQLGIALSELRRLRADNAELAKDAGRYCWIKAQGFATIRPANNKITLFTIASQHVDADTLDTAIDTAMASQ